MCLYNPLYLCKRDGCREIIGWRHKNITLRALGGTQKTISTHETCGGQRRVSILSYHHCRDYIYRVGFRWSAQSYTFIPNFFWNINVVIVNTCEGANHFHYLKFILILLENSCGWIFKLNVWRFAFTISELKVLQSKQFEVYMQNNLEIFWVMNRNE